MLLPLAACATSVERVAPPPPAATLPEVPADIRACLHMEGVEIPDGPLPAGEVERLWKGDRRILAAKGQCGLRALAWYDELRAGWR